MNTDGLNEFHSDKKHYLDACGNLLKYSECDTVQTKSHDASGNKTLSMLFEMEPIGLSNMNFGHITNPVEIDGARLEEVGLGDISTHILPAVKDSFLNQQNHVASRLIPLPSNEYYKKVSEEGELSASIFKDIREQDDWNIVTDFQCKGCSKYFATKASLKRHHDRKKSCKDICETVSTETPITSLPEKPYVVDWVEELLIKAVSGTSDKPYCKHCDVEFANKSNLNKHLSKSVACDKLAKQEFVNLLSN